MGADLEEVVMSVIFVLQGLVVISVLFVCYRCHSANG